MFASATFPAMWRIASTAWTAVAHKNSGSLRVRRAAIETHYVEPDQHHQERVQADHHVVDNVYGAHTEKLFISYTVL